MALNQLPRDEILQIFAEAKGDKEAAFTEVERRMRLGKIRWFLAECEYCFPGKPFKYEDQSERDTWAKLHSKISSDHVVRISESWESAGIANNATTAGELE